MSLSSRNNSQYGAFDNIPLQSSSVPITRASIEEKISAYVILDRDYDKIDPARDILRTLHTAFDQKLMSVRDILSVLNKLYEADSYKRTFGMLLLLGENGDINKEILSYITLLQNISRIDVAMANQILEHLKITGTYPIRKHRFLVEHNRSEANLFMLSVFNRHAAAANALLDLLFYLASVLSAQAIYALLVAKDSRYGATFGIVLAVNVKNPQMTRRYLDLINVLRTSSFEPISIEQIHALMSIRDKTLNYPTIRLALGRITFPEVLGLDNIRDYGSLYFLMTQGFLPEELYASEILFARDVKQGLVTYITSMEAGDEEKINILLSAFNSESALGKLIMRPRLGGRAPNAAYGSTIALIKEKLSGFGVNETGLGDWVNRGLSVYSASPSAAAAASDSHSDTSYLRSRRVSINE